MGNDTEIPLAETISAKAIYEIADLVYALLAKDASVGIFNGRLRDDAREALKKGTVIVEKDTDKAYRYPENALEAALLLGEIKYGIRHPTNLKQNDMDEMCHKLRDLLPNDYDTLIDHIRIETKDKDS